jgi:hypothetical protein
VCYTPCLTYTHDLIALVIFGEWYKLSGFLHQHTVYANLGPSPPSLRQRAAPIAQSVQRLATGLAVRCSNPGQTERMVLFVWDSRGFMGFWELCHAVPQNSVRDAKWSGVFKSQKQDISDNAHQYLEFSTVELNIYSSRTAINRPLTGRNRRGREENV